jgi:hypothetical protein
MAFIVGTANQRNLSAIGFSLRRKKQSPCHSHFHTDPALTLELLMRHGLLLL